MPLLTYLGPSYSVTLDGPTPRIRGEANEVSHEWLNKWRVRLASENWRIEGAYPTQVGNAQTFSHGYLQMVLYLQVIPLKAALLNWLVTT